jgi:acyl-CoA thioesterase
MGSDLMPDNLEIVRKQFEQDAFAIQMGIELDNLTETTIRMHMPLRADMLNLYGKIHGGVIFALSDAAFGVLGNTGNNISVAIDCSISYHATPNPDDCLIVEGELIAESKKIGTYLFTVYTESADQMTKIATMKGTLYRTGKPIQE